ncbi:MAG: methyltransferase [Anaerolineales bacterium]
MDALGSFFFIVLFLVRAGQGLSGNWNAWFLTVQSGLVAFRILFRKKSKNESPLSIRALAWLSALAPLSIITRASSWLALSGITLSIWSLIALGDSFSISPSDRGIVRSGPYRMIRHPMYAGELLSLMGTCIASPLLWNWSVLAVFVLSVYMRIVEEESMIAGYFHYTRMVAWRLVPYVW